jgi:superfamily II DNA or RNA helicase
LFSFHVRAAYLISPPSKSSIIYCFALLPPCPSFRSYQQAAVDEIAAAADTNYILVAPTGSGKTAVVATLAK